jgi:hypothetical protein
MNQHFPVRDEKVFRQEGWRIVVYENKKYHPNVYPDGKPEGQGSGVKQGVGIFSTQ